MISAIKSAQQKLLDSLEIDPSRSGTNRPVTVDDSQLKDLAYISVDGVKRYNDVPYGNDAYDYKRAAQADKQLPKQHPYDMHRVTIGTKEGSILKPVQDIWEHRYNAGTIPWIPYVNTLSLQTRPERYLEYLRLIESTHGNPWVEFTPDEKYRHKVTGEIGTINMYPAWTVDRFKETVVSHSLDEAFETLDIARTSNPELLDRAYTFVLNRIPEIKSWISEESTVNVSGKGKSITLIKRIHPAVQEQLKKAADDALTIVRQNIDKLAAAAIESRDPNNSRPDFIGPSYLNPLQNIDLSLSSDVSLSKQTSFPDMSLPAGGEAAAPEKIQPAAKKKTNIVPVAIGIAAAAAGVYAATR